MNQASSELPSVHLAPPTAEEFEWESIPAGTRKTLQSLGFEFTKLIRASQVLLARAKKATLPADVLVLALRLPTKLRLPEPPRSFNLQVAVEEREVSWLESPDDEGPQLSPILLALFHLPALRGFWQRELRQSHFRRLRRVLPKAWFVTDDPPIGAVVADSGITSWKNAADLLSMRRVLADGFEVVVENREPTAARLTLTYTRD